DSAHRPAPAAGVHLGPSIAVRPGRTPDRRRPRGHSSRVERALPQSRIAGSTLRAQSGRIGPPPRARAHEPQQRVPMDPANDPTTRLAEFAAGLRHDDIPAPVLRRAEDLLLDWI